MEVRFNTVSGRCSVISQPTYDGCLPNLFHSKTDGTRYVDSIGETLNSPEFLKDGIAFLESEIAEHQKAVAAAEEDLERKNVALAAAYAKPEYDRRVSDAPNVTNFEFVCRLIEPTCDLFNGCPDLVWVNWKVDGTVFRTPPQYGPQEAWRAAFSILDRRRQVQP